MLRRRGFIGAAAGLAAAHIARADATDTLTFVPVSDLTGIDPFWSATDITTHHVGLVFETLFAMDATLTPQPHMIDGYTIEDDGKRWRLTLRDGLRFHDGEKVRADDAVASVQRWGGIDVMGRKLLSVTDELRAVDDRVLEFRLKKPFPLLSAALAKPASTIPCIMPRRIAEIAGSGKPIDVVGSGPYRYLPEERVVGARVVYARFDGYQSRTETPSYLSGARIAHFPRVVWRIIPDPSTAAASLQKGEIDWMHDVPPDLGPLLQREPKVVVQVQDFIGGEIIMRFNALHPPFDNAAIRHAILPAINQADFMQAVAGENRALWRDHVGVFSLNKPMSTDAGVDIMAGDIDKARKLLAEAGYKGEKVVMLAVADYPMLSAVALVANDMLKRIGFNVEMRTVDNATQNQLRNSKNPPSQGGWSIFFGPFNGYNRYEPAAHLGLSSVYSGWPKIDEIEALRETWFDAPDLASRQAIARQIQLLVWRDAPYIPLGSYYPLTAFQRGITGVLKGGATFFNVRRS
jgi:peptide/nickel transport system substrate-binding protein